MRGHGHAWRGRGRHGRTWRGRRLQSRLFFWFIFAILLAFFAAGTSLHLLRPESTTLGPVHLASRAISGHFARDWDEPARVAADVARLHETLGIDVRVEREPSRLPTGLVRMGHHGAGGVTFDAGGSIIIPVTRAGTLLGGVILESERPAAAPFFPPWLAALVAALVVLSAAARVVARRLSRPLEDVADAAERFGGGDLAARTRVGNAGAGRRWISEEVREVAIAFDQMAGRIERVVRDQRELLGAISHELRSPLGRARVALEIARDRAGAAEPAASGPLDDIEHQLADVDAILGDLLAAARAGLSDVKPVETRIVAWLRARIAAEPTSPPIELSVDAPEDLTAPIDAPLLNRALHNVLANARAHGGEGGLPIEVRLEADPAQVRIVARDHGPGFPADLLPRAFEPFVKGDTARTPGAGYGLGLSLVRRIAEAHGGRAFAENAADGPGAEVGIELPRARTSREKMV